jgi:branched-chain amino acid transport system permease protein
MKEFLTLLVNGVALGAIYAILAVGFAVSYWPSRQFHFAYGGVFLVVSYVAWWLADQLHWPFYAAVLAALAAGALVGLLAYRAFYKPLATEFGVFMTAFGLAIVIQNLLQIGYGANPETVATPGNSFQGSFDSSWISVSSLEIAQIAVCAVVVILVEVFLRRSRTGTAVRALASDRFLTECVGIDTGRLLIVVYCLGSVLAGIGAILLAVDVGINPGASQNPLFFAVNGVLLGGTRNITGAGLGGLLLGIVTSLAVWVISAQWQTTVAFGLVFVILIFRPQGLLARKSGLA